MIKSNLPSANAEPVLKRMIELLADVNLSMADVDRKMMAEFPHLVDEGWKVGSTMRKMKQYPVLARTAKEARALIWRELGRSKKDGFRVISDALDAKKVDATGKEAPDHQIQMQASDRMLALMGETTSPSQAKMNVNLGGNDNKIVIIASDGKELDDFV